MNLLAIDHGNEYIKTLHDIFPSSVHAYDREPPMAKEWIKHRGKYYCLSGDPAGYKRDKTQDESYLVLTMFAMAREQKFFDIHSPIDLAVDLPPMHYGVLKTPFIRYFKAGFDGNNTFIYHNKTSLKCQPKVRSVKVFPQGFAAIAASLPEKNALLKKHKDYLLIDIGGYTIDIIPFENNLPVPERSATRETGILRMCSSIKDAICAKNGRQISVRDIQKVARGESTLLDGGTIKLIKQQLLAWSSDVLSSAAEKVEDISSTPIVFIGGGAALLEPYIKENAPKHKALLFLTDQKANVKGCQILANVR